VSAGVPADVPVVHRCPPVFHGRSNYTNQGLLDTIQHRSLPTVPTVTIDRSSCLTKPHQRYVVAVVPPSNGVSRPSWTDPYQSRLSGPKHSGENRLWRSYTDTEYSPIHQCNPRDQQPSRPVSSRSLNATSVCGCSCRRPRCALRPPAYCERPRRYPPSSLTLLNQLSTTAHIDPFYISVVVFPTASTKTLPTVPPPSFPVHRSPSPTSL
jgi:hypothetical protein